MDAHGVYGSSFLVGVAGFMATLDMYIMMLLARLAILTAELLFRNYMHTIWSFRWNLIGAVGFLASVTLVAVPVLVRHLSWKARWKLMRAIGNLTALLFEVSS